jgi:hypothetical protein
MSSHFYVLFLVALKPYQTPSMNGYVLSCELFYSALVIAAFVFSDATPELGIKFVAGVVIISAGFLLVFVNFIMVLIMVVKGRAKLKEDIKECKLKRAEEELMMEEEEEERRQKAKREEEEFTRLPDDATPMHQQQQVDSSQATNTGVDQTTSGDMLKPKKKKSRKGKGKGDEDNLTELQGTPNNPSDITQGDSANATSVMLNETRDQMMASPKKKKKGRKDKGKNRAD